MTIKTPDNQEMMAYPCHQSLTLNTDDFLDDLKVIALSKEEKQELIQLLWSIAQSFVDRAYNIDSAQLALQSQNKSTTEPIT